MPAPDAQPPAAQSSRYQASARSVNGANRQDTVTDVGLSCLTLDRAGATLSTGERQRIELTSTVRASTTGMLYVLDEPSVGLHPANVAGLRKTITALAGNGNTVLVVEHERELIRSADWVIELGPGTGASGGTVIAQGTPGQLETDPRSVIGPFLAGVTAVPRDRPARAGPGGQITIKIRDLYNLHDLTAAFPAGRLTALAGPSGAGKTALVLDSLIPAARARLNGSPLPGHVRRLDLGGIRQVIDHDLDLLAAADHLIDMGPGGGPGGGHIIAAGTPEDVARDPGSVTGPWLAEHLSLPAARRPDVLSPG